MSSNSHIRYWHQAETANKESKQLLWGGGKGSVVVWGTWGGATITIRMYPDDLAAAPIDCDPTNGVFTKDGMAIFSGPPGNYVATISGGAAASLSAYLSKR